MASESLTDQARIALLAMAQMGRAGVKYVMRSALSRMLAGALSADHLLIIPQDLRTADPSFAGELYDGYFGLAGTVALTGSESPFSILPPTRAWQRELYAFGWLNNLHAAQEEIAQEKARSVLIDWFAHRPRAPAPAWEVDIAARRLIALLSHAGFVLDGAPAPFYDAFMRNLGREVHYLTVSHGEAGHEPARIKALTALLLAGLCIADQQTYVNAYLPGFCAELERQILADGGHLSRNADDLVELLLDLLPLKQCFVARSQEAPDALVAAVNRMLPMIRFLRLGDGSLGRFNGASATRSDLVATVLAYDDHDARPGRHAPDSLYGRLARRGVVVIADIGPPPPLAASRRAHAGCLSFEMSSGVEPIIVNCGAPRDEDSEWSVVARSTAAHSTLSVNDESSARLIKRRTLYPPREDHLLSGPKAVQAEIREDNGNALLLASHDGYRERFGLIHQRRLRLNEAGTELAGLDQLVAIPYGRFFSREGDLFAIRFHLHPRVAVSRGRDENSVTLTLPNKEVWHLSAAGAAIGIEESIFFADPIIQKRSLQIVLSGPCAADSRIAWTITRSDHTPRLTQD